MYDTILQQNNCNVYINTDLDVYEQSLDNDVFYIVYKKFHPNGMIKEKSFFIPGVYTSRALPIKIAGYYDENGTLTDARNEDYEYNMFYPMVTIDFLLTFLEKQGYINSKTGEGKATMTINQWVDPHSFDNGNNTRLNIHSNWQISTDNDLKSSIGLLIKHDDETETVYLIDKNSKKFLKKFKR